MLDILGLGSSYYAKAGSGWIIIFGQFMSLSIFMGLIIFVVHRMDAIRSGVHDITEQNNRKSELIYIMYTSARERVLGLYRMLDMSDPFDRDEVFQEFTIKGGRFASARDELMTMKLEPDERSLLEKQGELAAIVTPQLADLTDKIQNDELDVARYILNEQSIHTQTELLSKLEELLTIQQQKSNKIAQSTDNQFYNNRLHTIVWSVIALFTGLFITVFMFRRVTSYENNIRIEAEKSNTMLESITDGIVVLSDNADIVYVNDNAKQMLTSSDTSTVISEIIPFASPEYRESFSELLKNRGTNKLDMGLYEIILPGGNKWLHIYLSQALDQDMTLINTVLVLSDVTEIKQSEIALLKYNETLEDKVHERTQEIERANSELKYTINSLKETQQQLIQSEKMASLGGLVAGVSHEINTPVGVSLTSATSMQESFDKLKKHFADGSLTEQVFLKYMQHAQSGMDILIQNLRRASELIKSFKQVAVDQSSGEWRYIDLKPYTDEIITSLHPKLKRTNVSIRNSIDDSIHIRTDPGAYYQIISNLILNSITHAFPDEIKKNPAFSPQILIEAAETEDTLVISYKDNGAGMGSEVLSKIYDPFFTTRRGMGGSGLGMNIIYNIVTTQFNGKLKAESTPGEGFILNIEMPLQSAREIEYE